MRLNLLGLTLAVCACVAVPVRANMYTFKDVSANDILDAAAGEAQLRMDVTDAGGGQVLFTFLNQGPAASSVSEIYFDNGPLKKLVSITNGTGVLFDIGANPKDLPSGSSASPAFDTQRDLDVSAQNPAPSNGINPGESLGLLFDLKPTLSFNDVLTQLDSGALRVGLHVQAFANGSESFVSSVPAVPVPGAVVLAGIGLALVSRFRRMA